MLKVCLAWSAAAVVSMTAVAAQNWPSFRGPSASGVAGPAARLPRSWNVAAGRHVAWKTEIPGLGHSSPIVFGDRIYVTTAVAASGARSVQAGAAIESGIDSATDMVGHTWRLLALDRKSGRIEWNVAAHEGVPRIKRHVKASHASATPATDGRYIVALLGSEGLFCFDLSGNLQWRRDLGVMDVGLVDDPTYQWGPASSPVIVDSMVIVQNDRHKDSFVAAYDLATGKDVWRAAHDEYPSWATPLVVSRGGRTEIVTNAGKYIRAFDPKTGRELWRLADNLTQVKVPTPVVADDLVIVTGGFPPGGRPIYAIPAGASGEITEKTLAWQVERGSPYTATPLVYDGVLYVCTDNGILSAYNPATGERYYRERVSPAAAAFSASPVAGDGKLYLASEDGDVFVVRAGRAFALLATNPMGEAVMATPALSGNLLIVRTLSELVALTS